MPLQPRENIAGLRKSVHGGFNYRELNELGINPDEVIDFSVSLSPAGIPSGIIRQTAADIIARYPDSQSLSLRQAIADKEGLAIENIIVGNGSTELIRLAALAYLDKSDKALIIEPTYGEYRTACEIAGAEPIILKLPADNNFEPDIDSIIKLIESDNPKIVFLCNPNNPVGSYIRLDDFLRILSAADNSLVVLDEAYISFVENNWSSPDLISKGNLLIIRSMTKDYALAGLRLGYAVACREIISILRSVCPPWNVNAPAQEAGVSVLQNKGHIIQARELAVRGKNYLVEELSKLGFDCLPSAANFFLVKVNDARKFRNRLLTKGILVRNCSSFGLPEYIRIAPKTEAENRKLMAAIKELQDEA